MILALNGNILQVIKFRSKAEQENVPSIYTRMHYYLLGTFRFPTKMEKI